MCRARSPVSLLLAPVAADTGAECLDVSRRAAGRVAARCRGRAAFSAQLPVIVLDDDADRFDVTLAALND